MRTTVSVCKSTNGGKPCFLVRIPQHLQASEGATKKRFPRTREGEKAADALVLRLNNARQSWSAQLLAMRDQDQGRLLMLLENAGGIDGLEKAVLQFKARVQHNDKLLSEAITEFMAQHDAGPAHHYRSERMLLRLSELHPNAMVADITNSDFNAFLNGNGWASMTKRYAYAVCRSFFGWASHSTRRYASENVVLGTKRPVFEKREVSYYSVDEISRLLKAAYNTDRGLVTYIAVGALAGPRVSEMLQMQASMRVDGHFVLPARITKVGDRRDVPVSPVLDAWLALVNDWSWSYGLPAEDMDQWKLQTELENRSKVVRDRLHAVAAIAGVTLKDNGLRHSFGTHNTPRLGDAATSEAMGNTIPVLRAHYKGIISAKEVERYHGTELMPENVLKEQPENVIDLQAAA